MQDLSIWDIIEFILIEMIVKNIIKAFNLLIQFLDAFINVFRMVVDWIKNLGNT